MSCFKEIKSNKNKNFSFMPIKQKDQNYDDFKLDLNQEYEKNIDKDLKVVNNDDNIDSLSCTLPEDI